MAAEEPAIATLAYAAVEGLIEDRTILVIDNSAQVDVAELLGFRVIREAFADRGYQPNSLLVPRGMPGDMLTDHAEICERAVRLARFGELVAADGTILKSRAQSLCIHGDTPGAVAMARAIKGALQAAGVEIRAVL
jgi:UPF0271 protein